MIGGLVGHSDTFDMRLQISLIPKLLWVRCLYVHNLKTVALCNSQILLASVFFEVYYVSKKSTC